MFSPANVPSVQVPLAPDRCAYAELHCRSNFSFQRGASNPEELVARAHVLGYSALAMTDECSVAGVVRAHIEAKKLGLKLLPGVEFVLPAAGHQDDRAGSLDRTSRSSSSWRAQSARHRLPAFGSSPCRMIFRLGVICVNSSPWRAAAHPRDSTACAGQTPVGPDCGGVRFCWLFHLLLK